MSVQNPYSQYKQNSVYTASPEELTLMLFNGLVKFLLIAQDAIKEKNIQKSNEALLRSQDIIVELNVSLDMKYEVSKGLSQVYDYMHDRLLEANLNKSELVVEEILRYSKELRDTWAQAMKTAKLTSNTPGTTVVLK